MERLVGNKQKVWMVLQSLFVAYLATAVMLLLLALILLKIQPDAGQARMGILLIYILSCLAGGIRIGRKADRKKFLWGLLVGTLYFGLLLLISGMGEKETQPGILRSITSFLLCIAGGMLGGMIS